MCRLITWWRSNTLKQSSLAMLLVMSVISSTSWQSVSDINLIPSMMTLSQAGWVTGKTVVLTTNVSLLSIPWKAQNSLTKFSLYCFIPLSPCLHKFSNRFLYTVHKYMQVNFARVTSSEAMIWKSGRTFYRDRCVFFCHAAINIEALQQIITNTKLECTHQGAYLWQSL